MVKGQGSILWGRLEGLSQPHDAVYQSLKIVLYTCSWHAWNLSLTLCRFKESSTQIQMSTIHFVSFLWRVCFPIMQMPYDLTPGGMSSKQKCGVEATDRIKASSWPPLRETREWAEPSNPCSDLLGLCTPRLIMTCPWIPSSYHSHQTHQPHPALVTLFQ